MQDHDQYVVDGLDAAWLWYAAAVERGQGLRRVPRTGLGWRES
jgi:hypothetical protein